MAEHSLALRRSQLGRVLDCLFHLGCAQVLLHAEGLGFEVRSRNTVFDQEPPGTLNPPFGKRLIVFDRGSRVGMAFESQVGVGFSLEILFEIVGERNQRLLLAGKQSAIGMLCIRPGGWKINAVQHKSGLNPSV